MSRSTERKRRVERSPSKSRSRERRSKDRSTGSRDDGTGMSGEFDFARLTLALTDAIRIGSKQFSGEENFGKLLEDAGSYKSIPTTAGFFPALSRNQWCN